MGAAILAASASALAEPVKTVVDTGWHPRLMADSSGRLHLLYHSGDRLLYRTYDSGSWGDVQQVPGSQGVSSGKATRHRMWVRPDGSRVDVSWGSGFGSDILYAWRDASKWNGAEIACPASVRQWEYASVASRSGGEAFMFCMFDDLWVARRPAAGPWGAPEQVLSQPSKHVVAFVDDADEIHLAYRFRYVHYLHGDGSAWSGVQDIATSPGSAELPAIVVKQATPHIAWQMWVDDGGWRPDTVRYATLDNAAWTASGEGVVVAQPVGAFNPPELAVTADGAVLVSWIDAQGVQLSRSGAGELTFSAPQLLADDAAAVQDGNLANDLATAPMTAIGTTLDLVYEDAQGQIVHLHDDAALPREDDAAYVSQKTPTSISAGEKFQGSVTMLNTGLSTWTAADGYRLAAQNPPGNSTWGMSTIELPAAVSVEPGEQHTFAATFTAPATAGVYAFQWQMRRDSSAWFGAQTPNVQLHLQAGDSDAGPVADGGASDAAGDAGLGQPAYGGGSSGDACSCGSSRGLDGRGWLALGALGIAVAAAGRRRRR